MSGGRPPASRCEALTPAQVLDLARRAGWRGRDARTAAAVALAESHGRPCAVGDVHLRTSKWGPSVCLWQVRSLNAQRGAGGVRDELANLADVETCARNAHTVWRQSGWRAWSTWLHGSHRRWLAAVGG